MPINNNSGTIVRLKDGTKKAEGHLMHGKLIMVPKKKIIRPHPHHSHSDPLPSRSPHHFGSL